MVDTKRRRCSREGCDGPVVGRRLCRRHYQAAWKAGEFAGVPLPPHPRPEGAVICPPEHKHDETGTCYVIHKCRCDPCRAGRARRERTRKRLKAYGRYDSGLVDVEPVREHMMLLAEFGLGYKRVARLAGVGVTAARTILWGRQEPGRRKGELQKRIKRDTAEKILAVKPDFGSLAGGAVIPARGVHRRVQALVAIGWSQSKLCDHLGWDRGNWSLMMKRPGVMVRTHREVAALFDELWDQLPPRDTHRDKIAFSRAKKHAKDRRWLPPLAWDDIDNDVEPPVAEAEEGAIDEMAVDLACMGERVRLTPLERREVVRRLNAAKLSDPAIAERAHVEPRTVLRIRQELGLAAAVGADRQVVA